MNVESHHLPGFFNHGIRFKLGNKLVSITEEREETYIKIIQEVLSQARDRGFVGSLELGVDLFKVYPKAFKEKMLYLPTTKVMKS